MNNNKESRALPVPDQSLEPAVAFYLTQQTNLQARFQGQHQVVTVHITDSWGKLESKPALRVTFSPDQSIKELAGLIVFGSDPRCHVVLPADNASPVHCTVYAQLNSGPQHWLVRDSSTQGTAVKDDDSSQDAPAKIVHGRRQAVKGLSSICIGYYSFKFHAPVDNAEVRRREDWFHLNKPIPVTRSILDGQLRGLDPEWIQMNLIGEGGGGKVFKYIERNTALLVAIKEQQVRTEAQKAVVMKEINFMKTLRHVSHRHGLKIFANSLKPYLVDIVFDESDNQLEPKIYTAMPLYLGDLGTILPLPSMPTTERVMVQIAEGLQFMHSNLILHRDLKPENILMVSPENIKIADYGWATSLTDTDSLYGMCGTTAYCAPEAFQNHEAHTTAIDVYSLGAIFYLMVDPAEVSRGWVYRYFNGRKRCFNTTFENASSNPPQHFRGLVQSMLAPNPKGRCSLDECIEVVKAQKYDWVKQTPLMVKVAPPYIPTGLFDSPRIANATALQQTSFEEARATVKMPSPTRFAPDNIFEKFQSRQQAPVVPARKDWLPNLPMPKPAAPTPQAVSAQKPCKPAPAQGVDFNAGLPSYEEAPSRNPFAVKIARRRKDKQAPRRNFNVNDEVLGLKTKEKSGLHAPLPAVQGPFKEKSLTVEPLHIVKAGPKVSIRRNKPPNSRQTVRRSRDLTVNIHRAQDARIQRRRDLQERQPPIKKPVADLKGGVYNIAKGYCVVYRALFDLAIEGLAEGGGRLVRMFKDSAGPRRALEHALPNMNANAQLVANMQRRPLEAGSGSRRSTASRSTSSRRQRSVGPYTSQEKRWFEAMRKICEAEKEEKESKAQKKETTPFIYPCMHSGFSRDGVGGILAKITDAR